MSYQRLEKLHVPEVCHPDRKRKAWGMCGACYQAYKWANKDKKERAVKQRNNRYKVNVLQLYAQQGGRCACCNDPFSLDDLKVDHSHSSGKARGLVCQACNIAIGWAENPRTVLALAYLTIGPSRAVVGARRDF